MVSQDPQKFFLLGEQQKGLWCPVHVHAFSCEENAGDLETVFPMVDGGQGSLRAAAEARLVLMG